MMDTVTYQKGFKYQIAQDTSIQTEILGYTVDEPYFSLTLEGLLTAKQGYSYDGASGCPDFATIMRGSLFHDILYQMIRLKLIARSLRKAADKLLERVCVIDGMPYWFAHYVVYKAVRKFGAKDAHPNNKRIVYTAP